jgi:hypothetical protein
VLALAAGFDHELGMALMQGTHGGNEAESACFSGFVRPGAAFVDGCQEQGRAWHQTFSGFWR